jgi:hypothetical protein
VLQLNEGLGWLFIEVHRSHTHTDTNTHKHTRYDSSGLVTSSSQRPQPTKHTIGQREEILLAYRDSNQTTRIVTLLTFTFLEVQNFTHFSYVPVSEIDTEQEVCVLSCSENLPIKFLILKIIQFSIIINVHTAGLQINYPLFFSGFNNCWIFSTGLPKLLQICIIKSHQVAKELFHADTQTDWRTSRQP